MAKVSNGVCTKSTHPRSVSSENTKNGWTNQATTGWKMDHRNQ